VAATILSGGMWCPPTPLSEGADRERQAVPVEEMPCEQAVPEGLANTLAAGMSKDHLAGGLAHAAAQAVGWTRPMIGKTETTQHKRLGSLRQRHTAAGECGHGLPPGPTLRRHHRRGAGGNVTASKNANGNTFGGKTPARTWVAAITKIWTDSRNCHYSQRTRSTNA
jgi:hypothetical protein